MKKSVEKSVNIENGCPVKIAENSTENVGEGGGCPVVHRAIDNQSGSIDVEKEYLTFSARQTRDLFNGLRDQTEQIEDHIGQGEREVLLKDEIAFLMRRHEVAISNLVHAQNVDYQKLKDRLESIITARSERKKAKREARVSIRSSKKRDQIIQQQEKAANAAFRVRETISERRAAFDLVTQHMYEMHEKQRKNMIQSQERRFQNEKLLVDLETRHLKEEVRSALQKKFQVRQNHQQHLNKRINDNLREVQLMELRHSKERFELEMVSFEEVGNKEIIRETTLDSLKLRHLNEMHNEKENVLSKHEQEKEDMLKAQHAKELRLLQHEQRIEIRQLKIKQDQMYY
jgi:hypothetical protein